MSNSIDETIPPILIEHDSQVCLIALNRPKSFNAVTFEMLDYLNRVLDQEERNPAVRTIVLTGAGKGFCAGADLKDLKKRTEGLSDSEAAEANGKFSAEFGRFLARLESFPKPVVAAVNGIAVAGGLEILLCCDLIIAARSARIGDAHSNYGLLPGGGATARLPRRVGVSLAKYLLYTGDILPASELAASGLLLKVVADEDLPDAARSLAKQLASRSPLVLRKLKGLVDAGLQSPLDIALRNEYEANRSHAGSHDRREGLAAFSERRLPTFTGN